MLYQLALFALLGTSAFRGNFLPHFANVFSATKISCQTAGRKLPSCWQEVATLWQQVGKNAQQHLNVGRNVQKFGGKLQVSKVWQNVASKCRGAFFPTCCHYAATSCQQLGNFLPAIRQLILVALNKLPKCGRKLPLNAETVSAFSPAAQASIVKIHNDLRSEIAKGLFLAKGIEKPPASDMMKISWDDSIAESAQTFIEKCPMNHTKTEYGENMHRSWSSKEITDLDIYGTKAAESWAGEFQKKGWESNIYTKDTEKSGIGHATQMVWSQAYLIGCGVKDCGPDKTKKNMHKITVVCRYIEKGNIKDTNIYNEGKTCSACPSSAKCEPESGLCT